MIYLRNTISLQLVWGFLALILLNISVDIPDSNPDYYVEDISYNEQESIVELVLEKLLGFENVILESEEHESDEQGKKSRTQIDLGLLHAYFSRDNNQPKEIILKKIIDGFNYRLIQYYQQPSAPPPKV